MKQKPSLDDVALFLAVADHGGLAGAARVTGASVPTLSRRMSVLEGNLGARLFERGPRGYTLTADGRAFLHTAAPLRKAAQRLAAFGADAPTPRIRITAGFWTSRFVARHIDRVWSPSDGWLPEFLASNNKVDIARREADIGIRNRRPEQGWLAGRRTVRIDYAFYARNTDATGVIALPEGTATTPSERWLRANHRDRIVTTANDPRLARDLARAGVGRVILPTYSGDPDPGLVRVSDPIREIAWPRGATISTPFSTSNAPKLLCRLRISMTGAVSVTGGPSLVLVS